MRVLLDTTVLIDALRGAPAAGRLLALRDAGDIPCTTAINVEEIVRGLRPRESIATRRLIDGLRIVPITGREGWRAGEWRRTLAARGTTIAQADALIAAAALGIGAKLATGNPKDFPMREVLIEHWPVGR